MTTRKVAVSGSDIGLSERAGAFPTWVPEAARNYLAHTEGGQSIRALAREAQVHPSTILRRVRRVESSRDDPLVDAALRQLSTRAVPAEEPERSEPSLGDDLSALAQEAMPVLRRLVEPGTVLAVARDMEKGVVVREGLDSEPHRLAVVDRRLAEAMALQDWITCDGPEARITRYRVTGQGRAVLRAVLAEAASRGGLSEAAARWDGSAESADDDRLRHMRSLLLESPLSALARRRDGQGAPFLTRDQVAAGERLREDFEVAQRGSDAPTDWDGLLTRLMTISADAFSPLGPQGAGARVARALIALGPGLADVALRCCCLLEGLEAVEGRMGWSARSGKIVLRIALERLARHYRESGGAGTLIG